MGPAQVHLAKTWQWYVIKDNDTQGEQVLKALLTLFPPAYKPKILDSGQTWKARFTKMVFQFDLSWFANKDSLCNMEFL